jgi:hypothetical protein
LEAILNEEAADSSLNELALASSNDEALGNSEEEDSGTAKGGRTRRATSRV